MRASQIVETEHFAHYGVDGKDLLYEALLITQAPMRNGGAEILAANGIQDSVSGPALAVDAWMKSEEHRLIVMSDDQSDSSND